MDERNFGNFSSICIYKMIIFLPFLTHEKQIFIIAIYAFNRWNMYIRNWNYISNSICLCNFTNLIILIGNQHLNLHFYPPPKYLLINILASFLHLWILIKLILYKNNFSTLFNILYLSTKRDTVILVQITLIFLCERVI